MIDVPDPIPDGDVCKLIVCRLLGEGRGMTQAELEELVDWARDVRLDAAVLDLMLEGKLIARRNESGEWVWRAATPEETRRILTAGK